MKTYSIQLLLLALLLAGCKTEPKNFNLLFKMESLGAYKVWLEINSDKSYSIKQQDLVFDGHAKKTRLNKAQGVLTDEEFAKFTDLLTHSPLLKMKDAYGFDEDSPNDPFVGLIYYLTYTEGSKTKYISLQPKPNISFPGKFSQLINFLINYSSDHLEKEQD